MLTLPTTLLAKERSPAPKTPTEEEEVHATVMPSGPELLHPHRQGLSPVLQRGKTEPNAHCTQHEGTRGQSGSAAVSHSGGLNVDVD